jgi:hypothetical protein
MGNEISALNLTVHWEKEYYREKPNNHYFWQLVYDCLDQLRECGTATCFDEEQKAEIIKRCEYRLLADNQDGIITLRRENDTATVNR